MLEKLRGIYALLVRLDGTARHAIASARCWREELRTELDLLWMTGELKLEKPTVAQEVAWALHFFDTTLFGLVWQLHDSLALALAEQYPGEHFDLPSFIEFGSWVGGDRDGNPNVTNEVTRAALQRVSREVAASLSAARGGAVAGAEHLRALGELFACVQGGARARARGEQRWRASRRAQSG